VPRASERPWSSSGQHHVLECVEVGEQLEALEHEAHLFGADRGAGVLVDREQVDAASRTVPSLGVSSRR
jgi:hypothetical protein